MAGVRKIGEFTTETVSSQFIPLNITNPLYLLQQPGALPFLSLDWINAQIQAYSSNGVQLSLPSGRFTHLVPLSGYISNGIHARVLGYDKASGLTRRIMVEGNVLMFDGDSTLSLPPGCSQVLPWLAPFIDDNGTARIKEVIFTYNDETGETLVHFFVGESWSNLSPVYKLPKGLDSIALLSAAGNDPTRKLGALVAHSPGRLIVQMMGVQLGDMTNGAAPSFFLGDRPTVFEWEAGPFQLRAVGQPLREKAVLAYNPLTGKARIDVAEYVGSYFSPTDWTIATDTPEMDWPIGRTISALGPVVLLYNASDGMMDYFRYQPT